MSRREEESRLTCDVLAARDTGLDFVSGDFFFLLPFGDAGWKAGGGVSRREEESRLSCDVLAARVTGLDFVSGDFFFFSRHLPDAAPIFFPEHFVWQGSEQIGHLLVGGVDESPHTEQVEAAGYMPEKQVSI